MFNIRKLPRLNLRKLTDQQRADLQLPPLPDEYREALERQAWEDRVIRGIPTHKSATCYFCDNASQATTAAPVKQPTGTAIRTMMQLKLAPSLTARIVEWGCSFDASAAATPGQVELFETTVAATMSTAFVNADITLYNNAGGIAQGTTANIPIDVTGTTTSGFATAAVTEGTVANYRGFDLQLLPPTAPYVKQFPLGREPEWKGGNFLRLRVTFGASINMYGYLIFEI